MMKQVAGLILWILLAMVAGAAGSQFTPGEWYEALAKPVWTPPNGVFAPVWTALYVLMGVSAWLVWRERGFRGATGPLVVFMVQLVLNVLWSYLFFGLHQPLAAFADIAVLWMAILLTIVGFWGVRPAAGVLLVPYVCWVTFASALNFELWRLNA